MRRLSQALGGLADMEPSTPRVDHRPVIGVRADFRTQLALRNHLRVNAEPFREDVVRLSQTFVVRRLRGQVHLARPGEVALDPLVRHQLLDGVDRVVVEVYKVLAVGKPYRAMASRKPIAMPGVHIPPLRPEAPQPTVSCSNTATFAPLRARCNAADNPVRPAPTTATSG